MVDFNEMQGIYCEIQATANVCYCITAVGKFLVPDRVDTVDSGIGLSFTGPPGLHKLTGRHNNPMSESTISPNQGLRIWPLIKPSPSTLLWGWFCFREFC
jgi:hypothetical protein